MYLFANLRDISAEYPGVRITLHCRHRLRTLLLLRGCLDVHKNHPLDSPVLFNAMPLDPLAKCLERWRLQQLHRGGQL